MASVALCAIGSVGFLFSADYVFNNVLEPHQQIRIKVELVEEAGGQAVGGLDMLIYQGIIAFELWNPGVIVTEKMVDTVRQMMTERLNSR